MLHDRHPQPAANCDVGSVLSCGTASHHEDVVRRVHGLGGVGVRLFARHVRAFLLSGPGENARHEHRAQSHGRVNSGAIRAVPVTVGWTTVDHLHHRCCPSSPGIPLSALRWLVAGLRQLQHAQRRIIHLMHKTVIAQVADLLVEESTKSRDEIELSQAAIATLLGASQQTVNEAVGHLRILGAVQTGYRKIQVVDVETLKRVAAGERA